MQRYYAHRQFVDDDTLARYRSIYGLGPSITKDQVLHHLILEGRLTKQLISSTAAGRWEVFERAYSQLYSELSWLNANDGSPPDERMLRRWSKLIRRKSRIFEVGSGKAALLKHLSRQGHHCVATEITRERGVPHADGADIEWHTTDGVHLDEFEPPEEYDLVISTQVIEHLHPDDLLDHLRGAKAILKPGGAYIFDTPHRGTGPHDLSQVLGYNRPRFMHLKEYDYKELGSALKAAGYRKISAVFAWRNILISSPILYNYYKLMDMILKALPLDPAFERKFRRSRLFRLLGPQGNIWLCAFKP
jgi:2-polyprenyl-3-methyl-5-hydroxy-6-metoxy-1,4-benzoquinol methylase